MFHPIFLKRAEKYCPLVESDPEDDFKSILLKTIYIPKNLMNLSDKLPNA